MGTDAVIELSHQAIKVTILLAAPMLLGALVIGIVVSLFQAITQINEQTLSFIPKIIVIIGAIVYGGPWMLDTMSDYTRDLIVSIPLLIAQQ